MRGSSGNRLVRSPASENVSTLKRFASAATVGRIHSHRPCNPGISTSGGPVADVDHSRLAHGQSAVRISSAAFYRS